MIIRSASPEDLEALVEIDNEGFNEPFPPFVLRQLIDVAGSLAVVAEDSKSHQIIGYVLAARHSSSTRAWLLSAATRVEARSGGVATALCEELLTRLRALEISEAFLTVRPDNYPLLKIAERLGAKPIADEPHYFGPGERRLVMRVGLGDPDPLSRV